MSDDFRHRLNFCNWTKERIREDPKFFRYVMFPEQSKLHGNGQLNRYKSPQLSVQNSYCVHDIDSQYRWSLATYFDFLQNKLPELLDNVDLEIKDYYGYNK